MRAANLLAILTGLLATSHAHAELRICNHLAAKSYLAVVWVNPDDAKTNDVPFTTEGWWATEPGKCTDVGIDGVLMYYRVESDTYDTAGLPGTFVWPLQSGSKFGVIDRRFKHYSRDKPLPNSREMPFAKFGAFPLYGKKHWLLTTLDVWPNSTLTESCKATTADASITMKC